MKIKESIYEYKKDDRRALGAIIVLIVAQILSSVSGKFVCFAKIPRRYMQYYSRIIYVD